MPTKPYSFTANTEIKSAEVNSDFDTLYAWANNSAVVADASQPFTNVPSGPASDPTTANQFTRKAYVDNRTKGVLAKHRITNNTLPSGTTVSSTVTFASLGVILNGWTMPDLTVSGRAVHLTLSWPFQNNPTGMILQFWDYTTDNPGTNPAKTIAEHRTGIPQMPFLEGPGGFMEAWIFDNSQFSAGTAMDVRVRGASETTAQFNLAGTALAPVIAVAKLV